MTRMVMAPLIVWTVVRATRQRLFLVCVAVARVMSIPMAMALWIAWMIVPLVALHGSARSVGVGEITPETAMVMESLTVKTVVHETSVRRVLVCADVAYPTQIPMEIQYRIATMSARTTR